MELLYSNVRPIDKPDREFFDAFEEYAKESDYIHLTTGFISVESTLFFQENLSLLPRFDLVIGMHAYTGFTRAQYSGLQNLDERIKSLGHVHKIFISKAFPFHGKVYTFWKDNNPLAGIIGSSNLSGVTDARKRIFEVDLLVNEAEMLRNITILQDQIRDRSAVLFSEFREPSFVDPETDNPLGDLPDVVRLPRNKVEAIWRTRTTPSFTLPLKCADKSNLNVYFGKGRENTKTGLIRPRSWYEIEVIVGKKITTKSGYPQLSEFIVVTDDGFQFKCKTSGDYSKNLRTKDNLAVLGAWIKGRLERAGILKTGDKITKKILSDYGRDNIELIKTTTEGVWLLDFMVR
ncbi:NgoFVII family restriction endonuclease [Candidatus Marinimicrobia bacterium MT.SAG.3]|nr:NgoFVII family restriction endonuclease [Candidatus Marinimicrobia bacterium MT.SAG.3]